MNITWKLHPTKADYYGESILICEKVNRDKKWSVIGMMHIDTFDGGAMYDKLVQGEDIEVEVSIEVEQ